MAGTLQMYSQERIAEKTPGVTRSLVSPMMEAKKMRILASIHSC